MPFGGGGGGGALPVRAGMRCVLMTSSRGYKRSHIWNDSSDICAFASHPMRECRVGSTRLSLRD